VPNAPADLYAGLGKNDQKLYIVPSSGLVVVRMGEDSGADLLGPSSFDNDLWGRLSAYISELNP
ncbi:MAG: serine hydrolase, partial [Bacteroidota bacterium]